MAVNGRTLVPVRFIAESLGAEVDWHGPSKTVLINSEMTSVIISEIKEEKSYEVIQVGAKQDQIHNNNSLVVSPGDEARVAIKGTPGVNHNISVYLLFFWT